MQITDTLTVFTDGGYDYSSKLGSWAFVLLNRAEVVARSAGRKEMSGSAAAELYAIINALRATPESASIRLFTDYQPALRYLATSEAELQSFIKRHQGRNPYLAAFILEMRNLARGRSVRANWIRGRSHVHHAWCDTRCSEVLGKSPRIAVGSDWLFDFASYSARNESDRPFAVQSHIEHQLKLVQAELEKIRFRQSQEQVLRHLRALGGSKIGCLKAARLLLKRNPAC